MNHDPRLLTRRCLITQSATLVATLALALPRRTQAKLSADEVVLEESRSPFNHILVTERGPVRTLYFQVDGSLYIESRIDRRYPTSLDLDYSRTMMGGFLIHPDPKRFLMIGFGGGQITNYLFHRFESLEIDAVDLDPEVIRLARKYFDVPQSPRYRTHAADGRAFIEQHNSRWDMIMLDAFRGVRVPFGLKTVEFYQALYQATTPRGVVVANLHSRTPIYHNDRNTFAAVFPQGYAFRSEGGGQASFVVSPNDERVSVYTMRQNARALAERFDFDIAGVVSRLTLSTNWDLGAPVLSDDMPQHLIPSGVLR